MRALLLAVFVPSITFANPPMTVDSVIDNIVTLEKCSQEGYIDKAVAEPIVKPKVRAFMAEFSSPAAAEKFNAVIPGRVKNKVVFMGYGCETAFETLSALPDHY